MIYRKSIPPSKVLCCAPMTNLIISSLRCPKILTNLDELIWLKIAIKNQSIAASLSDELNSSDSKRVLGGVQNNGERLDRTLGYSPKMWVIFNSDFHENGYISQFGLFLARRSKDFHITGTNCFTLTFRRCVQKLVPTPTRNTKPVSSGFAVALWVRRAFPLRQNSCRLYKTRTWGGDEGSEWQGTQRNSKAER